MNYWEECITEAFDDTGIKATQEQIKIVASWIKSAHECYGMANIIPNQLLGKDKKIDTKPQKATKIILECEECGYRDNYREFSY